MLLIVDYISPSGHLKINRFFLKDLKDATLISKENYRNIINSDWVPFHGLAIESQGLKHTFEQAVLVPINVMLNFKLFLKSEKIIFLSHDALFNYFVFFFIFFFTRKKVYVFEHNTVFPASGWKAIIKCLLRRVFSSFYTSIVFEDYIGDHLRKKYSGSVIKINHPSLLMDCNVEEARDIVSISGSNSKDLNSFVSALCLREKITGVVKGGKELSNDYVVSNRFFVDYDERILNSKIIVLDGMFDYRVSGVFYEALASNAYILMRTCLYSESMEGIHSNRVFLYNDFDELESLILKFSSSAAVFDFSVRDHNTGASLKALMAG